MHLKMKTLAALMLSLILLPNIAQTRAAPIPPASQPAQPDESVDDKVLPALDLQAISLTEFLDYLHTTVPGFQYVIARDPGIAADYPTLPPMKLQKVTLGQMLGIITEIFPIVNYHVESEANRPGSQFYIFKIHDDSEDGSGQATHSILKIYRLVEAVDAVAARSASKLATLKATIERETEEIAAARKAAGVGSQPGNGGLDPQMDTLRRQALQQYDDAVSATQKDATNAVLSLIKAALAQVSDSGINPVVQIHEETKTLVLRGNAEQVSAVQKALEALIPQAALAPFKEQLDQTTRHYEAELAKEASEVVQLKLELQSLRTEAESLRKEVLERETAGERLKIRLEATQKLIGVKE